MWQKLWMSLIVTLLTACGSADHDSNVEDLRCRDAKGFSVRCPYVIR